MQQPNSAAGRTLRFLTGLCLLDSERDTYEAAVISCEVVFRDLSVQQIEAYVDAEYPYDCAGSFKAEGLAFVLIKRIVCDDPSALTD